MLKNWRPLTLLDVVYKIASGAIANRLKLVLDALIDKDQIECIKGRFIGDKTRLIYHILSFTEQNDIPGLLVLIDFETAFDSVSWSFIQKVLKFLNFGPTICKWIETLYNNISSFVFFSVDICPNSSTLVVDVVKVIHYHPTFSFTVQNF